MDLKGGAYILQQPVKVRGRRMAGALQSPLMLL
jgi:hypothetical protein